MGLSVVVFLVIAVVALIWILFEMKHLKHKLFAIFLIALILFGFFSYNAVFKGKEIKVESISDVTGLAKIYFSWLTTAFNNIKVITAQVVNMDWQGNSSSKSL